ncbi:hypothetical protein PIB30_007337 [Stylosanthes scabra]|uniref:Legume lectin domain-containing protein n=1 Tax=Stylosanthes scabra TaxID=79078 RepID=A0ABU6Y3V9_9FABA|nr:hypothetical protein [Stylosanthes scabra]
MAFKGDAKVTKGFIELNRHENYRTGRAIYGEPLHLWDSSTGVLTDFTTSCTFSFALVVNSLTQSSSLSELQICYVTFRHRKRYVIPVRRKVTPKKPAIREELKVTMLLIVMNQILSVSANPFKKD